MKVVRKELFEFVVVLDEAEFKTIKDISDYINKDMETVLLDVVKCGFDILKNGKD